MPDFSLEQSIDGHVCGLDEVGRGPLAGPVVAACVYVPEDCYTLPFMAEIKDSKKLSHKKLTYLAALIRQHCLYSIIEVSPQEIDEINILQASLSAMTRALNKLDQPMDHALIDGNRLPKNICCNATCVVKGDNLSTSIAAASIVAKTYRDDLMKKLSRTYPQYKWDKNVGYPTKEHISAIDEYGITPYHRKSFAPVRNFLERQTEKKIA